MGQRSSSTAKAVSEVVATVTQSTVSRCTTIATQNQLIALGNVAGDVTISGVSMKQGTSINSSCLLSSNTQSELSQKISDQITQVAASKGTDILGLFGNISSSTNTQLTSHVAAAINMQSVLETTAAASNSQSITTGNVGGNLVLKDVTMDQTITMVVKAVQDAVMASSAVQEVIATIDQTSTSESVGILDGLFSGYGMAIAASVVMCVICLIVMLLLVFRRGGSSAAAPAADMSQYQFATPMQSYYPQQRPQMAYGAQQTPLFMPTQYQ